MRRELRRSSVKEGLGNWFQIWGWQAWRKWKFGILQARRELENLEQRKHKIWSWYIAKLQGILLKKHKRKQEGIEHLRSRSPLVGQGGFEANEQQEDISIITNEPQPMGRICKAQCRTHKGEFHNWQLMDIEENANYIEDIMLDKGGITIGSKRLEQVLHHGPGNNEREHNHKETRKIKKRRRPRVVKTN